MNKQQTREKIELYLRKLEEGNWAHKTTTDNFLSLIPDILRGLLPEKKKAWTRLDEPVSASPYAMSIGKREWNRAIDKIEENIQKWREEK